MRKQRGGSGTGHGHVAQAELLTLQKSGQFPDELVKIEGAQIHCVSVVYYESIKRELKTKLIYECRCDERLKNVDIYFIYFFMNLHASHALHCARNWNT